MLRAMRSLFVILLMATAGIAAGPAEFRAHLIEGNIGGGYAVMVTDMNKDGRPDVVGLTQRIRELAWYENPGWQRHVLINDMTGLVNMAAADIDGDGYPEISLQNEFSMVAAKSRGLQWFLRHNGDPRRLWEKFPVDEITTSHHTVFADIDGDGKKELINAPLIGAAALAPKYEAHVPLLYYHIPNDWAGPWKRMLIDETLYGVLHRVRVVRWDNDRRDDLLTASFSGITLHRSTGKPGNLRWENTRLSKGHEEEAPRAGASDVTMAQLGKRRILAAVEPWHGNEVVVYTEAAGKWRRKVIFDQLVEGHEICSADFNGDGFDDLVAGDRARGARGSAHVFFAKDGTGAAWEHMVLDHEQMSGSGCAIADINGDGRKDFVMIGSATGNLKWYENVSGRP
jgi:hypothetical protein